MHRSGLCVALVALFVVPLVASPPASAASTLSFAGQTWTVKSDAGGPGPNAFSASNAFVDSSGALHLKITRVQGTWRSAEVISTASHGFGHYQYAVEGALGSMDRYVSVGLFGYLGPDGSNEVDVELARFGAAGAPVGSFSVYPPMVAPGPASTAFAIPSSTRTAVFDVDWSATSVVFHATDTTGGGSRPLGSWTYAPPDPASHIPQVPMPVYLNLWLFHGHRPSDGRPAEIVVRSVTTP